MIRSRLVNARAARAALIPASVPELVMRNSSIDGKAFLMRSARATSAWVAAPNVEPRAIASWAALTSSRRAWPNISGPQDRKKSM